MCDECDESSGLYLAYFNKPGGKHWRPAQKVAAVSVAVDRFAAKPVPVTTGEVRRRTSDRVHPAAGRTSRRDKARTS